MLATRCPKARVFRVIYYPVGYIELSDPSKRFIIQAIDCLQNKMGALYDQNDLYSELLNVEDISFPTDDRPVNNSP
jgi:hypothetical protein